MELLISRSCFVFSSLITQLWRDRLAYKDFLSQWFVSGLFGFTFAAAALFNILLFIFSQFKLLALRVENKLIFKKYIRLHD